MFGFLKDKLKQTVEKFTKEVDKATEEVVPTEEQKKEIIEEIKKEQKEEKGFFARLKEKFIEKKEVIVEEKTRVLKDEGYGIEVVKEAHKPEEIKKKIEEGEKEIEALAAKKEKEEQEQEEKKKTEHKEEKGFFARLKEKFTQREETEEEREKKKEEEKKEELFKTTSEELKEFEEAFKEAETTEEEKETAEKKEEIIPLITETKDGETVVELHKRHGKEERKKHRKEETKKEEKKQEKKIEERTAKEISEEQEESSFFSALKDTIFKTSLSEEKFEELFWDLELMLLENNVAVEVIDLIKINLKKELVEKKILRGQINDIIIRTLRKSIEQTFDVEGIDIIEKIREKKPYIIVFVGINGSGKTTTIAKMIQKLKDNNLSCVVAAGDTFRAAAIQQLEEHTTRLNVKLIKHDYGSDPAAVGFDAIKYAQAHNVDCVLIDTAGRLHSNVNLMDEMKKIIRVTKPDMKIFIGEAITGNDCVDQARKFHEAVGIDGIILAKADVDEKGGAALSISYVTKKPILYLGTGQGYTDLEEFDKEKILEQLGLA
ncbi:MAG: signal recognition particle-docking protein FtsY [Nanoarchaeota archaeon]